MEIKASESIKVTNEVTAKASIRTSMTIQFLKSAILFAEKAKELEINISHPIKDSIRSEHRSYATMSIIASVAFLEATINEIYLDAVDKNKNIFPNYDDCIINSLASIWPILEEYKARTLSKYQTILEISKKDKFKKGALPYQAVQELIDLRNILIHYKPEWSNKENKFSDLQAKLRNKNIVDNPYSHKNDPAFPKKILSFDCAAWAIESSYNFVKEFLDKMQIETALYD